MRILYDSKKMIHKDPFGCLIPNQPCTIRVHIPATVGTVTASCVLSQDGGATQRVTMTKKECRGAYEVWECRFALGQTGLYFYYFTITGFTGTFRLFKQGDDTNMEAGDQWQVSCVPADFTPPDWAKGATIYQVFPDRF